MSHSEERASRESELGDLHWIRGFAVCRFDEDQGPVVDYVVPRNTEVPTRLIALLAFPDSNSSGPKQDQEPADQCFAFHLTDAAENSDKDKEDDDSITSYLGASYFRMIYDATGQTRRGGVQRAVCVVSEISSQPTFALFLKDLINVVGPMFFGFEDGEEQILESACNSITKWPFVSTLTSLELPIMGHVLYGMCPKAFDGHEDQARISYYGRNVLPQWAGNDPSTISPRNRPTSPNDNTSTHTSVTGRTRSTPNDLKEIIAAQLSDHLKVQTGPIYLALREFSDHMWAMWEQVLVGDPIVVFGGRGSEFEHTDEVVLLLATLITPLTYSSDYRPTLTVYDPGYRVITKGLSGTGNPFVCQTLLDAQKSSHSSMAICYGATQTLNFAKNDMVEAKKKSEKGSLYYRGPSATVPPSQDLLRALMAPRSLKKDSPEVLLNDSLIRRHFYDLTINFIKPFLPYLTSHVPQTTGAKAKTFIAKEFLEDLQPGGEFATLPRAKVLKLYTRFLKGPNFVPWFNMERRSVLKRKKKINEDRRKDRGSGTTRASQASSKKTATVTETATSSAQHLVSADNMSFPTTVAAATTSAYTYTPAATGDADISQQEDHTQEDNMSAPHQLAASTEDAYNISQTRTVDDNMSAPRFAGVDRSTEDVLTTKTATESLTSKGPNSFRGRSSMASSISVMSPSSEAASMELDLSSSSPPRSIPPSIRSHHAEKCSSGPSRPQAALVETSTKVVDESPSDDKEHFVDAFGYVEPTSDISSSSSSSSSSPPPPPPHDRTPGVARSHGGGGPSRPQAALVENSRKVAVNGSPSQEENDKEHFEDAVSKNSSASSTSMQLSFVKGSSSLKEEKSSSPKKEDVPQL